MSKETQRQNADEGGIGFIAELVLVLPGSRSCTKMHIFPVKNRNNSHVHFYQYEKIEEYQIKFECQGSTMWFVISFMSNGTTFFFLNQKNEEIQLANSSQKNTYMRIVTLKPLFLSH